MLGIAYNALTDYSSKNVWFVKMAIIYIMGDVLEVAQKVRSNKMKIAFYARDNVPPV